MTIRRRVFISIVIPYWPGKGIMFDVYRFKKPDRLSFCVVPVLKIRDEWHYNTWKLFTLPFERAKRDDV